MVSKRDPKLDSLVGKIVRITFSDGDEKLGVLEWDMPIGYQKLPSQMYSVFVFGSGYYFFRKSHVKSIKEWREKDEIKRNS